MNDLQWTLLSHSMMAKENMHLSLTSVGYCHAPLLHGVMTPLPLPADVIFPLILRHHCATTLTTLTVNFQSVTHAFLRVDSHCAPLDCTYHPLYAAISSDSKISSLKILMHYKVVS